MSVLTPHIAEALPQKGRVFALRTNFNHTLIESLKYLLEVCEEVISRETLSEATKKLEILKPESKLSGFLYLLHNDLLDAIEKQDLENVKMLVKKIILDAHQVDKITYVNYMDLDDYYIQRVTEVFSGDGEEELIFSPLLPADSRAMEEAVKKGFIVLERSFPSLYEETQELISSVLFFNGSRVRAGSSCDIFGVIYLGFLYNKWKKITDILDFITHEQSHLYVYLLNKDDALVCNPLDRHESPLRAKKRPLMGVYHATFVLMRIVHVLRNALKLGEIPEAEKSYCQELIDHYQERAQVGVDVLEKNAQMTPLGKDLISSGRKLVA